MPWLKKRRITMLVIALILFGASSLAHALYVKFEGTSVTWSNTRLGGGPAQPMGWVQVPDIAPGFTGDIPAQDFLSVSSVLVYGTYQTVTWGPQHLVTNGSQVSFREGEVSDINLVFYDADNDRLLVVSGPPSANTIITNTPRPPCAHWPGFDDLEFCGARVAVELSTPSVEPSGDVVVQIPSTPSPTYPANAQVGINGSVKYKASGGLLFDAPYTNLNAYGPFRLIGTLEWNAGSVDEPKPWMLRVWFTKIHFDHTATLEGQPINLEDDDYWALGEPLSWLVMKAYTLANINAFCAGLNGLHIGVCTVKQQGFLFNPASGKAAFGVFDNSSAVNQLLSNLATAFLFDLTKVVVQPELNDTFQGSLNHRAVTVPVLEAN
ncbi:MAG TPA: hypothetical protein VIH59_03190 [Candidatus Tectomicrobia bacterium]|jgi:hypothetical protein